MRIASPLTLLALLLVPSCDDASRPPGRTSCADVELIVAASDYRSSVVCGAPGCVAGAGTTGDDLGADPMLASSHGRTFLLARDNDAVFELDACGAARARIDVIELAPNGRPANPHDAAASPVDGTVVIPIYGSGKLAFAKDGKLDGKPLDLSGYDDDGNPQPDAVSIVDVGGRAKAFVTLELLDDRNRLLPRQSSRMLRVDVATRTVEAVVDLAGRNPFNAMSESEGSLFLAEPGNVHSADDERAGIERFDTATSTGKILLPEKGLGGSVVEVAVTKGCGAAIVAGPIEDVNPTWIITFDPTSGKVLSGAPSAPLATPLLGPTAGYDLQGLAWRGTTLYVGDRRRSGSGYSVHVLEDGGACTLRPSGRTIDLPQRPVALRAAK